MNFSLYLSRSLKTRVTLFTLTIFIVSIWLLAIYSGKILRHDMQHMLSDQQFSTASYVAGEINHQLESRLQSLENIAASLSPSLQDNPATVQTLLEGRTVFQSLFNGGTFVTGIDGVAIADVPSSTERVGVNYLDREYMLAALTEGKTTIGRPIIGKKVIAPIFAMATPIRDVQGKVIGALVGITDLSKPNFLERMAQGHYGKTGDYLLVAPQHRMFITGTENNLTMQPLPGSGVDPLLDRYIKGFEGSGVIVDSRGVEVLSSAKQIPTGGWFIVVRIPTAEAFAPIDDMQQRILLVTIFMTLLAGGLTWWMLRRQLAPMLTAVTLLSTQADSTLPSQPLPITNQDEIGKLLGGFNRLLENLVQRDEALRENRNQLSNIIDFLPNATLAIDKEGRVTIWNKAIEEMTGIPAAEMIGKGDHSYMVPFYGEARMGLLDFIVEGIAEVERISTQYQHIVRKGNALTAEVFGSALYGGKGAWIFVKVSALYDEHGNILGAIESIRDISKRKLVSTYGEMSQEVLQILNEPGSFKDSVQHILAVMKTRTGLDAVGIRLQEGNDYPYLAQEGFSKDFLQAENSLTHCGLADKTCRNSENSPKLEGACGMVISGRTDPSNEFFTAAGSFWVNDSSRLMETSPDKELRLNPRNYCAQQGYCSIALVPIRNKDRIVGLIQLNGKQKDCFTLNTVELLEGISSHLGAALMRKRAEEALKRSEARFAETLSVLETGLWDLHIESGRTTLSSVYHRILGYTKGEIPATYEALRNLIHPDDKVMVEQHVRQVFAGEKGFALDLRMKTKSGEWLWVAKLGKTVEMDAEGKALRMVGTLSDITQRKKAEEEMVKLQAHLNQSQKMGAIGTLAGGIAHDFNNILGIVIGYAEMAQDDCPAGSRARDDIGQVLQASHRAKELVKQILAFSRMAETETIPLRPAIIIKEAVKMLRSSLPTTIDIQQNIDPQAGVILADPTQIHQVLINLCTNAFHAMETIGGTLSISLKNITLSREDLAFEPLAHPGQFVQLSIGDSGSGISHEIQEKMFEPYFTTKEVGKGTGMGLAIVYGIVKNYGGIISCRSQPGKGTIFHVYLPVIANADPPESNPGDIIQGGNERILFIDDEEMLVKMGKNMLENLGYQVTERTNSIEALTTFENQPLDFDLVITDQTMPGMSGIDLAQRILQIRPGMPIILCTGFSSLISEEKAGELGIDGFVLKPLTKKDIAAVIRKVLDKVPEYEATGHSDAEFPS